jgi:hypothetical protein
MLSVYPVIILKSFYFAFLLIQLLEKQSRYESRFKKLNPGIQVTGNWAVWNGNKEVFIDCSTSRFVIESEP